MRGFNISPLRSPICCLIEKHIETRKKWQLIGKLEIASISIINVRSMPATKALQVMIDLIVTISLQGGGLLLLFTKCNLQLLKTYFILSATNTVIRELSVYI